jgi:far upstream element-binding protein
MGYGLPAQPIPGYAGLPMPTNAGTFDLSAIRPVNTGSLNLNDGAKPQNFADKGYGGPQSGTPPQSARLH